MKGICWMKFGVVALLLVLNVSVFAGIEYLVYGQIDHEHCLFKFQWSEVNFVHKTMDTVSLLIAGWAVGLIGFKYEEQDEEEADQAMTGTNTQEH